MLAICYPYRAPGFPPKSPSKYPSKYPATPPEFYTPRPLAELLAEPHPSEMVLCPIEWPGAGPAFRPRKPWLLDPRIENTPYRLVMLDYDTEGHKPWRSLADATAATATLHRAIVATFGASFTYASRRGVRALFLTPAPVPLYYAQSYLSAALDAAPLVAGLQPPDRLTWTTGQRPPWVVGAGAPWGDDYPPTEATRFPPVATWEPPCSLADERGRLQPRPGPARVSTSQLEAAAWVALRVELDAEVSEMVATLQASTARHPTLFACSRRLGGYLSRLDAPESVVAALTSRYSDRLVAAVPGSNDAARTVRDGIEAGWGFPTTLPSEQTAWLGGEQ